MLIYYPHGIGNFSFTNVLEAIGNVSLRMVKNRDDARCFQVPKLSYNLLSVFKGFTLHMADFILSMLHLYKMLV